MYLIVNTLKKVKTHIFANVFPGTDFPGFSIFLFCSVIGFFSQSIHFQQSVFFSFFANRLLIYSTLTTFLPEPGFFSETLLFTQGLHRV